MTEEKQSLGDRVRSRLVRNPGISVLILLTSIIVGVANGGEAVQNLCKGLITPKPTIEDSVKSLSSSFMGERIIGASNLGIVGAKNKKETQKTVKVLEAFINERAKQSTRSEEPEDIIAAFESLSVLLKKADEKKWNISKPEFKGLKLIDIDLSGIYLRGVTFAKTTFDGSILNDADISESTFIDVRFTGVNAYELNGSSMTVRASCFEGSIFEGAMLNDLKSHSSDFNSAIMKNVNLRSARFDYSRLTNVDFDNADLTNADLSSGFELTEQQISKARFRNGIHIASPLYKKSRLTICNPN